MNVNIPHLIIAPIIIPLMTAALMILLGERRARTRSLLNLAATLAGLVVAVAILLRVNNDGGPGVIDVYLTSNWEAPFGIVLVADRLTALMLVLVGVISLGSAAYSMAGWSRAGVNFHPLFQIQLMGLNGAFLTGDLFNLFVFFEVALAASYGLHLHGSGLPRVKSGLQYIAVNLIASSMFLVGLAMLYGVMGTLSMADVAAKLPFIPEADRGLLHAGAAILAVAFLTKAAIWPLNSWLVPVYGAASAPVAALFALMTKLGIYTLLRLWTLLFSGDAGASAHFGANAFLYGGLATIAFGVLGLMASLRLGRIAGYSIIVSSGTLLASIGVNADGVTSAALYYLLSATLAASAMFLLVDLVERTSKEAVRTLRDVDAVLDENANLDDDEEPLVGSPIPVSLALLGAIFGACVLVVAGLPPLSGFVAKLSLISALLKTGAGNASDAPAPVVWWIFGALLLSGLVATISLARVGIRRFWSKSANLPTHLRVVEAAPIVALILACVGLTVWAEPVLRYTQAASAALYAPSGYIDAVSAAKSIAGPTRAAAETGAMP
ncbi:MAG: monovalent cation/H+ antiporter subunit D [Gemmatimonas sp.]